MATRKGNSKTVKTKGTKMKENKYGYKAFAEWGWRSYDGRKKVSVEDFIKEHDGAMFFIGTDSQNYSKRKVCVFTTALIAYHMGKGGAIIIHRDKVPHMESLRQRLLMEAMRSLETAWFVNIKIPDKSFIGVHLDVNQSLKYKSGQYKDELVGLIVAQGFSCKTKPDAFAASFAADKKC